MLGDKATRAVGDTVHPEGAERDYGQVLCGPIRFLHTRLALLEGTVMLKQDIVFPEVLPQNWKSATAEMLKHRCPSLIGSSTFASQVQIKTGLDSEKLGNGSIRKIFHARS